MCSLEIVRSTCDESSFKLRPNLMRASNLALSARMEELESAGAGAAVVDVSAVLPSLLSPSRPSTSISLELSQFPLLEYSGWLID